MIILSLLIVSALILAFKIQSANAQGGTITINADGSVTPSTAPISTTDNITYTLTGNINATANTNGIVIERYNIVLDGAGYTLAGSAPGLGLGTIYGIMLTAMTGVTVRNIVITGFSYGILLDIGSGNTLSGNTITGYRLGGGSTPAGIELEGSVVNVLSDNDVTGEANGILLYSGSNNNTLSGNTLTGNEANGIELDSSSNNTLSANNVMGNNFGIFLYSSSDNNILSGNEVANNYAPGIELDSSSGNTMFGNTVTANKGYGIWLVSSPGNYIFHNSLVNNSAQAVTDGSANTWDNGYPSGGNYWSNYNGTDLLRGANQNVPGSDGIGDTPYIIDGNNTDHYPLMGPYGPTANTGSNISVYPSQDFWLIFQNVTAAGTVILNETATVPAPAVDLVGPYYVINVTASFSGNVKVIVAFDGLNMTQQEKGNLTMMQYTPIPGDVAAPYGQVDMSDIITILYAFGSTPGKPNWNPACNLEGNGRIVMGDVVIALLNFGKTANWINITLYVDTTNNIIYGNTTHFSFICIH